MSTEIAAPTTGLCQVCNGSGCLECNGTGCQFMAVLKGSQQHINLGGARPSPEHMAAASVILEREGSVLITNACTTDFPGFCALSIGWGAPETCPSRERYNSLERLWSAIKAADESGIDYSPATAEACKALREMEKGQ